MSNYWIIQIIAGLAAILYIIYFIKQYSKATKEQRPKLLTIYCIIGAVSILIYAGMQWGNMGERLGFIKQVPNF